MASLEEGHLLSKHSKAASLFFLKAGVKSPPPTCTLPPRGDPSADYLQSIVMETKDGAMVEIYDSPNGHGGVKTWEIGRSWGMRKAHLVPSQHAVIHRAKPPASQKRTEVNLGHQAGRLLSHHRFSELQCRSLWCHWSVQSAEFLMRSGQKYDASCPYSELISCFGPCRDPSSAFISS